MNKALSEQVTKPVIRQGLSDFFRQLAQAVRNQ